MVKERVCDAQSPSKIFLLAKMFDTRLFRSLIDLGRSWWRESLQMKGVRKNCKYLSIKCIALELNRYQETKNINLSENCKKEIIL